MIEFLDSSVLVKRYVRESGSAPVRRLAASPARIAVARIAYAEVAAALARAERETVIDLPMRDAALDRLTDDLTRWDVVEGRESCVIGRVRGAPSARRAGAGCTDAVARVEHASTVQSARRPAVR